MTEYRTDEPDPESVEDGEALTSERTEPLDGDAVSGMSSDEDGAPTPTGTVPPAASPDDDLDEPETPNTPLSERLY
jgi:hypothetical protein